MDMTKVNKDIRFFPPHSRLYLHFIRLLLIFYGRGIDPELCGSVNQLLGNCTSSALIDRHRVSIDPCVAGIFRLCPK